MNMRAGDDEVWRDDEAGPLIRAYAVTEGRTRPTVELALLSLVVATGRAASSVMDPTHLKMLELCHAPISVAEVAAHIRLPVMVTKILLADLVECEAITTWASSSSSSHATDLDLLERLLDGLQRI